MKEKFISFKNTLITEFVPFGGDPEPVKKIFNTLYNLFLILFIVVALAIVIYGIYTLYDIARHKNNQEERSKSIKHLGFVAIALILTAILASVVLGVLSAHK